MLRVRWLDAMPPPAVRAALASAGVTVSDSAPVAIGWSKRARTIQPPERGAWLLLVGEPITPELACDAAVAGAYDTLSTTDAGFAESVTLRLVELSEPDLPVPDAPSFVAVSAASRAVLAKLWRASRTSMPLLLTGETGTGKDLAARLVHAWSERSKARFVAINCAAIPNELIESELFGYARGAFSGASRDYDGQISAASGGSVFLDEIDDTPQSLQVKLLRVLEDHVVSRLGENAWRRVDFRIIAATNRDLIELIGRGAFGSDLYERLAIVQVELPPLRERIEDLPALAAHLIARFYSEEPSATQRGMVDALCPHALAALSAYDWPGNVRELRNVIFEALVHKRAGNELLLSDLPRRILRRAPTSGASRSLFDERELERRIAAGEMNLRREVERLEREALAIALQRAGGNASRTARLLGEVGRGAASDPGGTVRAMMRRLGMSGRGRADEG